MTILSLKNITRCLPVVKLLVLVVQGDPLLTSLLPWPARHFSLFCPRRASLIRCESSAIVERVHKVWHIHPGESFSSCRWRGRKRSHRCRPKGGLTASDLYFVWQIFKQKSLGHSPVASVPASSVHVLYGSSVRPDSPPGKITSFLLKTSFLVDTFDIREKKHFWSYSLKVREFGLGDEAVAAATQGDMVGFENVFWWSLIYFSNNWAPWKLWWDIMSHVLRKF